jgi:ribose/xylose/arabinose/galactoside ABC-type transport system permease subunit
LQKYTKFCVPDSLRVFSAFVRFVVLSHFRRRRLFFSAVVVVGGTAMSGGKGHYAGMVGGALMLTALATLLSGTTLPPAARSVIYGLVVLVAVVSMRSRAAKH